MTWLLADILRSALVFLAFAAVVLFVLGVGPPVLAWIERRRARAGQVQRRLNRSSPVPLSIWGAPLLGVLAFLFFAVVASPLLGLLLGYVAFRFADSLSGVALRKRALKFEEQFVDALAGLANSVKAGMSLPQAVGQVAKDMPAPVSEEFGDIMREYESGRTIEQALDDARERVQSRNFDLAVRAFRVGIERGGNVAQVFERIATSIREMWRLQEHIRTVTTEGRSSARFMTLMPLVFMILLYFMDPDGMGLLFSTSIGVTLLVVVFIINIVAHLWIHRILDVDV